MMEQAQNNAFVRYPGSIAAKLIACTLVMFLMLAAIIASLSYDMYKKAFYDYGNALCLSTNAQAAYAIDGDTVSRFAQTLTVNEDYIRFAEQLDELSGMANAKYFYVLVDKGVPGMYTYIYDATHSEEFPGELYALGRNETKAEYDGAAEVLATGQGFTEARYYNEHYGELYYAYAPIRDSSGKVVAFLGTDVDITPMHEQIRRYRSLLLFTLGSALILSALIYYLVVKHVLSLPLRFITHSAQRLAAGDLELRISPKLLRRNDEIGHLAQTFESMGNSVARVIFDIEHLMKSVCCGHMAERADLLSYQGDYHRIIAGLNSTLDLVNGHLDVLPEAIGFFDFQQNLLYGNKAMTELMARFHLEESGQDILSGLLHQSSGQDDTIDLPKEMHRLFCEDDDSASFATEINPQEPDGEQLNYALLLIRAGNRTLFPEYGNACVMMVLSDITQLTRARNDALAASHAKSDFLSRMSHEIRTPMNAIIGMALLASGSDNLDKIKSCLVQVERASSHLLGVINDILDFSKIEAGKMVLDDQEFHLSQDIDFVLSMLSSRAGEKRVRIQRHIENIRHEYVCTDSLRLNQVLINLLSNAIKFSYDSGVIDLSVQETGYHDGMAEFVFTVRDHGIGMSAAHMEKLFRPFEQGDSGITRAYGGTGLGLVISKGIVSAMGGEISFESEPGQGSVFRFSIQVRASSTGTQVPQAQGTPESNLEDRNFKGLRVLIVDDIDINREILLELLKPSAILMEEAENGQIAVDMFAASAPGYYDMVLMDMQMPVLDGCEATRRIRAMPRPDAARVQIIAMTANVMKEDVDKALAAGMNAHTGKPIELNELFSTLENAKERLHHT